MNRKRYTSDPRYSAVLDNMDLLGITDVSTERQDKNGTIQWRLPLKNIWPGNRKNATYIEVASFHAGYVRRQNGCYTPYQLNKRPTTERYYKDYRTTWNDNNTDYTREWTGKYNKYTSKITTKIPIEIDRLEYLISYCLKNYYIKHANQVANGEYVPKWEHEWELERSNNAGHDMLHEQKQYENKRVQAVKDRYKAQLKEFPQDCGYCNYGQVIKDLEERLNLAQEDLSDVLEKRDYYKDTYNTSKKNCLQVKDLQNKLDTIKRIADYE